MLLHDFNFLAIDNVLFSRFSNNFENVAMLTCCCGYDCHVEFVFCGGWSGFVDCCGFGVGCCDWGGGVCCDLVKEKKKLEIWCKAFKIFKEDRISHMNYILVF